MRNMFAEELYQNAIKDKSIYIVVADISPAGNMQNFQKKYPDRFINVGVSEMTMIGMCAGLALEKKRPFAYTIANFALYRPFEMVRNDLCYQNLPVTIVGMGAGTTYANLGGTHITQEDISIARSIPNMSIIAPSDPLELQKAVRFCCTKSKSPVYLRIGKSGEKNFTLNAVEKWQFGKIRKIIKGRDVCILSYGPIMQKAFKLRQSLIRKNYNPSIYSCSTLKPFDITRLKKIFKKFGKIVIIEDHSVINGLSHIAKVEAYENHYLGRIIDFNLKDKFLNNYESQEALQNTHGLSDKLIFNKTMRALEK